MNAKSGSLTVLLLVLCALARAQTTIGQFPSGLVSLTDGWRYSAGDDPAWANPDFNDAGWERHAPELQTDSCRRGCWFRFRIGLGPRKTPLALFLVAQRGVSEIYIDGKRV